LHAILQNEIIICGSAMEDSGTEVYGRPGTPAKSGEEPRSRPQLAPEQRLGGYVLIQKLGAGGIGEVWKARDTRLNRVVALKFIAAERPGSSPMRDLLREARAASALNHPNIVTIFEVGEGADSAYLAMEFVEGETLRSRLKRPPVPAEEALEIAQQILAGLAAAHRNGIVHRDLKPENIMLRLDGLVKLMDFGLAKVIPWAESSAAAPASASTATDSGAIVGTLTYMSPEQARGHPVTAASDVFSFGIVFYELLTGEHPFQGGTAIDTLTAILSREPANLNAKAPAVPPAVSAITARALEKDSSRRYSSGVELSAELKQAILAAATPGGAADAGPEVRHKPRWMQGVGVALMAAIVSVAAWRLRAPTTGAGISTPVRSVAVMNFHSEPEDQGAAPLAQDLPEELGTALSKTGWQIASHESVLQLGAAAKPRDVGTQLGVDAVLEGSVRTFGGKFKIYIELDNTRTGFLLWSATYNVEGQDVLAGEQKTAANITEDLRQALAAKH
jgi:eukaryotic-like serine/threonine-protein kinase